MSVVLITGSSTGIGEATALHFARLGDTVYATMRTPDRSGGKLRAAAEEDGLDLHLLALDVTDDASVERAVGQAVDRSGVIDVLVNNAGVSQLSSIEEVPVDAAKGLFETNVFGALRMMQAVLPGMRERRGGTIVNVSSVAGRIVSAGHGVYAASKHALEALSEAAAIEMRRFGVRVIVIEPGFISTPILDKGAAVNVEDSVHAPLLGRMRAMYLDARANAEPPSVVAEVIAAALADPEPKLRYQAGLGASSLLDGRTNVSDEEWIDLGREMTDEEYFAASARIFAGGEETEGAGD